MEAPNRENDEHELAAALLLLWLLLDGINLLGDSGWTIFKRHFDEKVRPILVRIYGTARSTLADQFGHSYQASPATPSGSPDAPTVIRLPGLNRTIDQYAEQVYESFKGRRQNAEDEKARRQAEPPEIDEDGEVIPPPEPKPPFQEHDANMIAVTTITEVQSNGEMDAARDVEARIGTRLEAVWRTEPGACSICSPLEGTVKEWRRQFPKGTPAHPNCRCWLEWRPVT